MTTRYAFFMLTTAYSLSAFAQTQNALDFDGVDDEVTLANASALIANETSFSITCWVYPTQTANWPNMEAFAGFRDNLECDFYLLQTYGTTLEGRFRSNANVVFTVDSLNALTLNAWQFVALTYDGAYLSMYCNGVLLESVAANGIVTSTTGMFRIGNMPIPGSTQIFLDGMVDETTLWKRGLTEAELLCIMNNCADPSDPDLQLYFRMDQGTPGGTNTGLTSLIDASGNQNGTLAGFALSGASSNFVAGSPNDGTTQATICAGESYELNGQTLTQSGIYTANIAVGGGCDSVVVLELEVLPVNTSVLQNANLLIAQANPATFQWINCANNQPIAGATSQYYTAFNVGEYAVIVTQAGCSDTSACFNVATIGMDDLALPNTRVWPSITSDLLNVEFAATVQHAELSVVDMTGRTVMRRHVPMLQRTSLDVADLVPGAYYLQVAAKAGTRTVRFVRE